MNGFRSTSFVPFSLVLSICQQSPKEKKEEEKEWKARKRVSQKLRHLGGEIEAS